MPSNRTEQLLNKIEEMDKKIHDMEIIATSRALTPAEFNTLKQMLRILTLNNIELMLLDNEENDRLTP